MDTISAMMARTPRFEDTLRRIREAGTDSLAHFANGYEREGGYSFQQNPKEFAALVHFLRERAGLLWLSHGVLRPWYLEIGSASGGTLRYLFEQVGFDATMSIDNHGHHRWVEQEDNWRAIAVDAFVGDSHGPEASEWLKERFDLPEGQRKPVFAFIDGDHSFEGVAQDVALVKPHLLPGSLVIFHDTIACEGVMRAWREVPSATLRPVADYVDHERPLGIGVLEVV